MEQDLATSDETMSIRRFLKEKREELGCKELSIKDWTLFMIG